MSRVYKLVALLSLISCSKGDSNSIPESLDWRNFQNIDYMVSFEFQILSDKCNSSWAILVAASLSDRLKILRKGKSPDIQLSPQLLLSCSDACKGCSGGDAIESFKFISNNGIVDNQVYSYQSKGLDNGLICDELLKMNQCGNIQNCNDSDYYYEFGLKSYEKVSGVEGMMKALQGGPIVCKILNDKSFMSYKTGIYDRNAGESEDYAYVSIVGYGSESNTEYWIGRNAYGSEWGDKGYFRIIKGKNLLNIERFCAYGVPSDEIKVLSKLTGKVLKKENINHISFDNYIKNPESNKCPEERASAGHKQNRNEKLVPKHRFLIVFGPSQFGKSTFIYNLLDYSNSTLQIPQMGVGDRKGVTYKVDFYKLGNIPGLFPDDIQNIDEVTLINVPVNSDAGIYKEEIFEAIKVELLNHGITSLDAILMFESMKDDSRKIYQTMQIAEELFGKEVRMSTIVLSTKWNRVVEDERELIEIYFDSMIKVLQVPTMKWQSNYGNKKIVTINEMHRQITELGLHIKNIKPYSVEGMTNLLKERDELAIKIRENYSDRFSQKDEDRKEYIPEEYIKEFEIDTLELTHLTEDEINIKAQLLFDSQIPMPGGLIPDPSGKRNIIKKKTNVPKEVHKNYENVALNSENENHSIPYREVIWVDGEEEIDIGPAMIKAEDNKLPVGYFRELVRNEAKYVQVKKKVLFKDIRYKEVIRKILKNQEKHDFEFYQKLAYQKMSQEFIERIRN